MNTEELDQNIDQIDDGEQLADLIDAELAEEEKAQEEAAQEAQQSEIKSKMSEAMGIAVTGVQIAANAAEKKWDCLKFEDKTRVQVAEKAAAVLAKYDCKLPPWLEAYKEEIELGLCLGGVIVGAYMTIKEHKKREAANEEYPENDGDLPDEKEGKKRKWL